jgi:hypothetical protein
MYIGRIGLYLFSLVALVEGEDEGVGLLGVALDGCAVGDVLYGELD